VPHERFGSGQLLNHVDDELGHGLDGSVPP
jgi:hypothetical protein